jgi:hypothetical protein
MIAIAAADEREGSYEVAGNGYRYAGEEVRTPQRLSICR